MISASFIHLFTSNLINCCFEWKHDVRWSFLSFLHIIWFWSIDSDWLMILIGLWVVPSVLVINLSYLKEWLTISMFKCGPDVLLFTESFIFLFSWFSFKFSFSFSTYPTVWNSNFKLQVSILILVLAETDFAQIASQPIIYLW